MKMVLYGDAVVGSHLKETPSTQEWISISQSSLVQLSPFMQVAALLPHTISQCVYMHLSNYRTRLLT